MKTLVRMRDCIAFASLRLAGPGCLRGRGFSDYLPPALEDVVSETQAGYGHARHRAASTAQPALVQLDRPIHGRHTSPSTSDVSSWAPSSTTVAAGDSVLTDTPERRQLQNLLQMRPRSADDHSGRREIHLSP